MNKITLLLFVIIFGSTFNSCKKEDPAPANNTTTQPTTSAPDSLKFSTSVFTFGTKTAQVQNGKWLIEGNYGSGYQVWIYTGLSAQPTSTTTLTLIPPTTPQTVPVLAANQAYIYVMHSTIYESYWGGNVTFTVNGSTIVTSLNNVQLSQTSVSTQIPIWMQMTYP